MVRASPYLGDQHKTAVRWAGNRRGLLGLGPGADVDGLDQGVQGVGHVDECIARHPNLRGWLQSCLRMASRLSNSLSGTAILGLPSMTICRGFIRTDGPTSCLGRGGVVGADTGTGIIGIADAHAGRGIRRTRRRTPRPVRHWASPGPCGHQRRGDGFELGDQFVELGRREGVVRRGGELVGQGFDALLGLAAGVGEPPVGVDEPALAQSVHDRGQPLLPQVMDAPEGLRLLGCGRTTREVGADGPQAARVVVGDVVACRSSVSL
jgi:hypothetical protein